MTSFNSTGTDERLKIAPIFRRNIRPHEESPNLLLTLPPELRNHIYELVLPIPHPRLFPGIRSGNGLALLMTCKQIRREGSSVYFGRHCCYIAISPDKDVLKKYIEKLSAIFLLCGPKPFKSLTICVIGGVWDKLDVMLGLLDFMRRTGFKPATKEYQLPRTSKDLRTVSDTSVFQIQNRTWGKAQFILEKALALGRRARDEEWTEERLATHFGVLVRTQRKKKGTDTRILVDGKLL
ncbi:hypothetical protein LTR37_013270 [Vermiconidia calcicola]|uniref:Uncharacterized protein n=1 Tax=Vermiconidia calcicola TaxID=1690605 RepID=A0ACC3MXC8_9PEZI|nr:hypothetical protein LTR37_013270 [Vermiconidia calcicola]